MSDLRALAVARLGGKSHQITHKSPVGWGVRDVSDGVPDETFPTRFATVMRIEIGMQKDSAAAEK